jgi:hypothetical protein
MVTWRRYNTGVENAERIQDATRDCVEAIDTERPYGLPTSMKYADYQASFGEVVLTDPKDGQIYITLPKCEKKDIGKHVTVKKVSSLVTAVHIRVPTGGGTIDSDFTSVVLGLAYQVRTFMVVGEDEWVQVSGVGF